VVKRTINGQTKRYVERFYPVQWTAIEDAVYVDSCKFFNANVGPILPIVQHLAETTISIFADGCSEEDQLTSATGAFTLTGNFTKVAVGLPYNSILEPMGLDVDPATGVHFGLMRQIREVSVRVSKSLGFTISDGTREYPVSFRTTNDNMDEQVPLFTGDKEVSFDGDFELDSRLIIKQTQPLPLTVLGLAVKYQVTGK